MSDRRFRWWKRANIAVSLALGLYPAGAVWGAVWIDTTDQIVGAQSATWVTVLILTGLSWLGWAWIAEERERVELAQRAAHARAEGMALADRIKAENGRLAERLAAIDKLRGEVDDLRN